MQKDIEQALAQEYRMFFHPGLSVDQFSPCQTLEECVNTVNYLITLHGRDFSQWDPKNYNVISKLMRASWIYQRLTTEPIRKPILIHKENNKFVVDCGDTRLMAVSALSDPPKLSALITVKKDQADTYRDWIEIKNNKELVQVCGFDTKSSAVYFTQTDAGSDWCFSWLEIGDYSTSHHLHDVNTRVNMLQAWMNTQAKDFCFSTDWIRQPIDWAQYQAT